MACAGKAWLEDVDAVTCSGGTGVLSAAACDEEHRVTGAGKAWPEDVDAVTCSGGTRG